MGEYGTPNIDIRMMYEINHNEEKIECFIQKPVVFTICLK